MSFTERLHASEAARLTKDAIASLELRLHRTLRTWPNDSAEKVTFYRLIDLARESFDNEVLEAALDPRFSDEYVGNLYRAYLYATGRTDRHLSSEAREAARLTI